MTPQTRNRVIMVFTLLLAGAALAVISFGRIGENLVYYWSPSEVLANGEDAYGPTIRLGGVVKPGTIKWDEAASRLTFEVSDTPKADAKYVHVISTEVPPQMFRDGIGVVVEGTFDEAQIFSSNRLMVNHSNEYRAPKEGEDPKQWRNTLSESTARSP